MKNLLLTTQKCNAFFLLVLSASLFAGCSSRPSAGDGRQAVQNQINQEAQGRIKLVEFHKTNGQSAVVNAVKLYSLEFEAQIEFTEDCKWVIGNFGQQLSFRTSKPVTQRQAGTWGQFIDNAVSNPGKLVKKGERIQLFGIVHYEKKENGWSVDGIDLNRAVQVSGGSISSAQVKQPQSAQGDQISGTGSKPLQSQSVADRADEERNECVNNLRQIGIAFRMWADDHDNNYPFTLSTNQGGTMELCRPGNDGLDANSYLDLQVMSNELDTPKILVCPSDSSKQPAANFESLSPANVSYQIHSAPNVRDTNPQAILARCPIHGTILYADGSVQQVNQSSNPSRFVPSSTEKQSANERFIAALSAKPPQIDTGRAIAAVRAEIGILKTALDAFKFDTGHYPKSLSELIQNSDSDPNWHGPYITGSTIPKDPWGHEYIYKMPGTQNTDSYDLMSMGPNGEIGLGMPTVSSNSEKIVGSWNFNVNASVDMLLVAHPKITPAELKGLRGLWSTAYARTTFVATADHRAALENVPRFRVERGVAMTSEKVTFEGQWRNDGPNYNLSLNGNGQSRAMTASPDGSRLTLKSGNEVWVFDRGNAPAIIAETSVPNKANESQEQMVLQALIQIDGAKNQWALETAQGPKAVPTATDLKPYLPDHLFPVHPAGGKYIINALDQPPESSEYGKLDELKVKFHDQLHPKPSTPDFANMTSDQIRNLVINDLRMIDGAEQQWALENGKTMGAIPTEADLRPYLPGGYFPEHPPGGHFTINPVGQDPASSTYGTLSDLSR